MNRSRALALAALVLVCLSVMVSGGWLRATYDREWLQLDATQKPPALRPWAVEADCYSQLARVQRILRGEGLIQNHFKVENWPEGLVPSTTSPFDYLILILYAPLTLFTKYPLDWAGALVSPFLWIALSAFWMFFRSREFNLTGKTLLVIGLALLPSLIWATAFGRPKHLSLTLVLVAFALTAEFERWHATLGAKRGWQIFAGVTWALACWSSLFEPVLILALIVVFNLAVRRRENLTFLLSFGMVMLVALLVEGVHVFVPPAQYHAALINWLTSIGEVQGYNRYDLSDLFIELTLILFALPFLAWRLLVREGDRRTDWFLVGLTLTLFVLTLYQRRWLYYVSLAELLLVVRYCQQMPLRWPRVAVIGAFLVALIVSDVKRMEIRALTPAYQPSPELAQVSRVINQPGGIMAPWWLSPGLLYFSGQPIVSGSSHCGISGIVDSAKFYTTSSWIEAEQILRDRKVRWVLVVDDRKYLYPYLNVQRKILGLPEYTQESDDEANRTVWQILLNNKFVPTYLQLRAVTPYCRLYEYMPDVRG